MKWQARIKMIEGQTATLEFIDLDKTVNIPMVCLPKSSRKGDILRVNINFDPYSTLKIKS